MMKASTVVGGWGKCQISVSGPDMLLLVRRWGEKKVLQYVMSKNRWNIYGVTRTYLVFGFFSYRPERGKKKHFTALLGIFVQVLSRFNSTVLAIQRQLRCPSGPR